MKLVRVAGTAAVLFFAGMMMMPLQTQHAAQGEKQGKPEQRAQQPQQQQQRAQQPQQQQQRAQQPQQQQQRAQQPQQQQQRAQQPQQQQQRAQQPQPQQQRSQQPQQQRAQQPQQQRGQQPQQQQQRAQQPQQQRAQQPQQARQQTQPQRTQQQARAWQQQRGWQQQGGAWQAPTTWQQGRATQWSSQHRTWAQRGGYGGYYVPQASFNLYFGSQHFFHIGARPVMYMGYPRFQYGGYSFMLLDPWPEYWSVNWYSSDDLYIDYDDGYYLYDRRYPDVRLAVMIDV